MISPDLLPKKALNLISQTQQSYTIEVGVFFCTRLIAIDEFIFLWYSPTKIDAWYADELLATWDGEGWKER